MDAQLAYRYKNLEYSPCSTDTQLKLVYVSNGISAGFPSPAMDFEGASIDLNKELIRNPATTFFARVRGHSMEGAGIFDNDLLVIDRSLEFTNNRIAVCFIDGEFTIKRVSIEKDCIWLKPENDSYKPIKVTSESDILIWGIVIHVIKSF